LIFGDGLIAETLRLWPPGFQVERVCTKEYTINPKSPNEREVLVEKGVSISIPVIAIHRDSQYYPDPERFDPERFSEENKAKLVPGAYLPFGVGPRNCIGTKCCHFICRYQTVLFLGSRFALLEIKTLFFHLLSRFDILPLNATPIPLKISPKKMNLSPENGFRLGFRPRKVTFY
jgi:cytochrome P450 family 9